MSIDPLIALRRHAAESPWSVAELSSLADGLLGQDDGGDARPLSERTIRFYVSRGVVSAPSGRGRSASWQYRHLIELLAARLGQREGGALDALAARRSESTLDALERFCIGRLVPVSIKDEAAPTGDERDEGVAWRRWMIAEGLELHVSAGAEDQISADAIASAIELLRSATSGRR